MKKFYQGCTALVITCFVLIPGLAWSQQVITQTFNNPGAVDPANKFTPPAGVTKVRVQAWGAGGGGGGADSNAGENRAGGGGAGGSYTDNTNVTVTPGVPITVTVGAGGVGGNGTDTPQAGGTGGTSTFASGVPVAAVGGAGGQAGIGTNETGAGGPVTTGVTANGGSGAEAPPGGGDGTNATGSGAGGGSGGPGGAGGNATGITPGSGNGGGAGAAGLSGLTAGTSGVGNNATEVGGGGSGGWDNLANNNTGNGAKGGDGFRGEIIVSYVLPTVTIARLTPLGAVTNAGTVTFRVTFSETVTGVAMADFAKAGSAAGTLNAVNTVSGTAYDVVFTGVGGNGNLNLDFAGSPSITSATGNDFVVAGGITSEEEYTIDTTQPTVVLNDDHADAIVRDADVVIITAAFTEANGLSGTPTISIAGLSSPITNVNMSATGDPLVWTYSWNVPAGDNGAHAVSIAATDAAGNANTAATAGTGPTSYTIDNTAPTVVLDDDHADAIVRDADAVVITATFTETNGLAGTPTISIAGLSSPISNVNMTATGDPLVWTYNWNVPAGDDGAHAVSISVTDVAGNANTAATAGTGATTYTIDNTGPSVVLNDDHADALVRDADVVVISAVFTEANGLTGTPTISIAGLTVPISNEAMTATGDPLIWTYSWNVPAGDNGAHAVSVSANDVAGNANSAATAGTGPTSYTIDNVAPVVLSVTSNAGAAGTLKIGDQITFTVDIQTTEAGLTISPTTYNGGTLTWSAVSGGDTYTATYTVTSGESDQTAALQLTGVTATDVTGNTSGAVAGADVVKLIDANNPPAFTTGTATTLTAPVVAGFWNSSNTGINIDVPIPADVGGQFSLVGGVVKIQGRVGADAFADIAGVTATIAGGEPGTTKTVALTDTQFESIANFANGQTAQLRAVITDVAGNFTTGGTSATNIFIDQSAPAAQTVGSLTTTGGRVVALYWNSTNTGLDVVVPLSNADATLDNGSVQLQLMVTGGSFANIPGTGLSTITNGQRMAGTKTISVTAANLEGTPGFAEGLVSGFRSLETQFLIVRAVTTDAAGNSTNFNQSTTQLDVDQASPTVTSPIRVYSNAGTGGGDGNHEVILFTVSEPMTDHAATPAERAHDFAFIAADNAYGSTGISVDDGLTDEVRYFNDGSPNAIDNTFSNTRLIYVESKDNTSNWSVANATNARHVRGTDATSTNAIMRDPAGNQLVNFITTVTAGATTTLSGAASGVAASPLVNSSTNQVVHAFALTSTGALNLTALTVNTVGDPAGLLSNFRLFSFSGADDFSSAGNLGLTPTVGASTITFGSMSVGLSTTTRYFWLVADVAASFPVAAPTLQFNITTGDFTVSTGGKDGTTQTSLNYGFDDNTVPAVQSISLPDANPNATGSVDFTVTFSEIVNVANNLEFSTFGTAAGGGETISFSGSGATRTVTVSNISLEGTLGLTIIDDNGSITDLQSNPLIVPGVGFSSATYQVYVPEPLNDVTNFDVTTIGTTNLTVTWTNSVGYPIPHGYYITAERSAATAPAPVDGVAPGADQPDLFAFTTGYRTVTDGSQTATFTVLSGVSYTFKIYPFTNSGTNINFKVGSPATTTETSLTASTGSLIDAGTNIVSISSLSNTFPASTPGFASPTYSLYVQIWDDQLADANPLNDDNTNTRFSQLVISAGLNNTVPDWSEVIEEAQLMSFETSDFVSTTEVATLTTTNITANTITFSSIPVGDDQMGDIDDGTAKYYQLYIRLRTPMNNANGIRALIDGLQFGFEINAATAFTYAPGSSVIRNDQVGTSENASNIVNVIATELRFVQQPTNALLGVAMSPAVSVEATDAHGNRDLGYSTANPNHVNIASTGTLTAATTAALTAGIGTASVAHSVIGNNLTLTGSVPGLTSTPASSQFNITASNQSTIVLDAAFTEPTDILYAQFQASNITTATPNLAGSGVDIARFTIRDGGGVADADAAGTTLDDITFNVNNWEALRQIALYNGVIELAEQTVTSGTVTFNNLNYTATDNSNRNFTVRVSFKNTAADIVDNDRVELLITNATTTTSSSAFAATDAGGATSSLVATENKIEVVTTQLIFTTNPPAEALLSTNLTTSPVVEALDNNGILDVDYIPGSGITVTNTSALPMINQPTSFTAGVLTFPAGFQYTQAGNGTLTVNSSTLAANGFAPAPAISSAINVRAAISSTITAGGSGEPVTISSIVNASPGVQVFDFTINDDAGSEDDGKDTQVTGLYIIAGVGDQVKPYDWTNAIAGATLSDGTNTVPMDFMGTDYFYFDLNTAAGVLLGNVPDGASKTFNLNIWLRSNLGSTLPTEIDGLHFQFEVVAGNVFTDINGTSVILTESENSGVANRVEVTATKLDITTPSADSFVSLNAPVGVVAQARDANENLDLDFGDTGETLQEIINGSGATMTSGPGVGTAFVNGVLDMATLFPNFRFTSGDNNDDVTLSLKAGTGTNCGVNAICTSPPGPGIFNPALTLKSSTLTAGVLSEPLAILSTASALPGTDVFDFVVNDDDNQASGTDNLPTRISQITITQLAGENDIANWTQLIQSASLNTVIAGNPVSIPGTVNATDITFTGISSTLATDFGYITDNTSRTYTLRIVLNSALGGSLPATVDNLNIAFEVLATNITEVLPGSLLSDSESENSGTSRNAIQVTATKLKWTTNPAADQLVNKDISLQLPIPVVEALDANNNRDLNYVTTLNITNAGALPMSGNGQSGVTTYSLVADGTAPSTGGIYTLPNDFLYESIGNGTLQALPSAATTVNTTHPERFSTAVTVRVGIASTITAGALTEPTTISSLADNDGVANPVTGGTDVFDFIINDDPGATPATENDGNPTRIQSILITQAAGNTIANWSDAIAAAQLTDGTSSGFGTISATTIDFGGGGGIPNAVPTDAGYIADNASKTYTLKIWLKGSLGGTLPSTIDGLRFAFGVDAADVVTNPNGTSIIGTENENSGANNQVTVVATQLDFSQLDGTDNFISPYSTANFPITGSIFTDFTPRLGVEAHDENANRDLDFTGSVTSFTAVTPGVTTQNDPSGSFTSGTLKFPTNFNYTSGDNQDGKLRISAGGINNQDSPSIIITSSFDSWLYFDPSFTYTTRIPFVTMQEAILTNSANSLELARLVLSDGGAPGSAVNPTGIKNLPFGSHNDTDGAFTRIDQLTISLTNFGDIRRIALFDVLGNKVPGSEQNAAATVTFTGLAGVAALTAADNDVARFYIRASFNSTVTADLDQINIQIVNVVWSSGSKFPITDGTTTVGGIDGAGTGGDSSDPTKNFIDVVATSLDFVTPGSPYAGINEPLGPTYTAPPLPGTTAAIVHARDKFGNRDLEFDFPASQITVTGGGAVSTSPFVDGVLNLDGMTYTTTGNGTLRVEANGLDSSNPPAANTLAIPGGLVNVVNVTASLHAGPPVLEGQGIPATYSIKGGSLNQVIFGVTFTASGATGSEPSLKKFSISFNKSFRAINGGVVTDIFTNFKVLQGATDISSTLIGGSLVYSLSPSSTDDPGSRDIITVDLTANPQPLYNGPLTYYLVADVDPTANISTPSLTPSIIDGGYGSTTDANIVVTKGTASGTFDGNTYTFASTKPPLLLTAKGSGSDPYTGQLNVDAGLTQIKLQFDVAVTSLDGGLSNGAELYNRSTNVKVADLVAVNGLGNYLSTGDVQLVVNPLTFNLNFVSGQSLQADEVYYVTIKKGSFDPIANTGIGISDQGLNFFGGISSNAILYFKVSSNRPLKLVDIDSDFNNENIGTLSTEFDQFGTAYYLIVPTGATPPTSAQVVDPSSYALPKAAAGSYAIDRINSSQTVSFPATYVLGQTYDIYIYAENDANPDPVPSGGIFDSNLLANGGAGPTLQITLPSANIVSNRPDYLICPNSYVTLSEPIIIGESIASEFSSTSIQDFNVLLPPGYEFDGVTFPSVQLIGGDFNGNVATMKFVSNTVLNIAYENNPLVATTIDYILISNLRIKGIAGSTNQQIQRFYGTNTLIPSVSTIGTIGLVPATTFNFNNSYSVTNSPFPSPAPPIVTAIPDNYIDEDPNIAGSIRLSPIITVPNDYNGSTFSGTGVTNDLLTLSAVPSNTAFNITMTHVDPNGCVSEKSEQYLVYDHRSSISKKLGTAYPGTPEEGTAQALVNVNFPNGTSPTISSSKILFNELAGYRLLNLSADLPASEKQLNANGDRSQIISGAAWRSQVRGLVNTPPSADSVKLGLLGTYVNYTWDYARILNAVSESNGAIAVNPYDGELDPDPNSITGFLFRKSSGRNTYWTGGSLGKVEFTGVYRSSADLTVIVPFRQQIELFVPPVPVVEVGLGNQTSVDIADPLNPVNPSNPGTPVFCEQGGAVTINGFPAASATSTGVFDITTLDGTPIPHDPLAFVDNGNGTATLSPYLLNGGSNVGFTNGYQDFKIAYRFQENNSPAFGTAFVIVRIEPNPLAVFTTSSAITPNTPLGTEFCEGIQVNFDASTSSIAAGTITNYQWNFGDATGSSGTNPNDATGVVANHRFDNSAVYTPSLTVISSFGCASAPAQATLKVGSIPEAEFTFLGVSTADDISFTNTSTLGSAATVNDDFSVLRWTYDSINAPGVVVPVMANFNNPVLNAYANAGVYKVNLHVTSLLGCADDVSHDIIVVPREAVTDTDAYVEDFESGNGGWQHSTLGTSVSSWAHGTPGAGKTAIQLESKNGAGIWVTNLNGFYNSREESALYSPSFDISALDRPMISFDHFTHLAAGEGVALEYSTDNKNLADPTKVWKVLGEVDSGVEWYTANGLSSQPGFQNFEGFGWSSVDTKWAERESKHILDSVRFESQVVFRFALATLTPIPDKDGFAIDNVRVGNRTRTVLVENFKNLGNDTQLNGRVVEEEQSELLSDFKSEANGTKLVKVNYHVGFPKKDPFNIDNPQDPSSRALYYNIRNTPIVKMDGGGFDDPFSTWGSKYYDVQTLKLANARIDIDVSTGTDGSLNADVTITSVAKDLGADTTLLHVMVVEKNINRSDLPTAMQSLITTGEDEFEFVMKKMLPSASGTRFTQALADGQSQTFRGFTWTPDRTRLYTVDNLAVIAFVQGEKGREVFQAEIRDLGTDPPAVTGLEPGLTLDDVTLYPNPADDEVTIRLPRNAVADVNVQLFDQAGRAVQTTKILKGQREKTVNVRELPASVYLIKLEENSHVSYKRAMVIHRN